MMQPINYLLQNQSPIDAVFGGMKQVQGLRANDLTNQHNQMINERMQGENEALEAKRQRQLQMYDEIDQLDFNDMEAMRAFAGRYSDMAGIKGVQTAYAQLSEQEQQAMLSDTSRYMSALRNGKSSLAIDDLRNKAQLYRQSGDEAKAKEAEDMAKLIEMSPETALGTLSMGYALIAPKDAVDGYKNLSEAYINQDKTPAEIGKVKAETGKLDAETVGVKADTVEQVGNAMSAAALVRDPQLFKQRVDMFAREGLLPPEHAAFFDEVMALPPEQAAAALEGYAMGNPEIAKAMLQSETQKYVSDNSLKGTKYTADTNYDGRVYTADRGLQGQIYNADSRERGNIRDNQTRQYTAQVQAEMQKYGIDVNSANAQQKLEFERQQEAIRNNQGEIKEYNGKAYFVKKDGTVYQAFDENGNELRPSSATQKPLTEGQAKDKLFGTRMQEANKIINDLEAQGIIRGSMLSKAGSFGEKAAGFLPSIMGGNSPEQDQYIQAQRDFINAILRRESGAVIGEEEFENAQKQYFPQVGDSDAVIEQKRRNRELATRELLSNVPARGGTEQNQASATLDISDLFTD